jgi:hypothetical protein
VRTRVAATASPATATTLREDLRRAAPIAIPALPRAVWAARRIPWRGVAIGLGLLATVVIASLAWRRPAAGLRVSPHMAQTVRSELDLIDLEPYREDCSPGDYERHLEEMRSGKPDARDVACLAARGTAGVVGDVLDGAPLVSPDALTALRLRRNAASALAGLRGEAVEALCARLGDEREEARLVVATALAVMDDAATVCVRQALSSGSPAAQAAAAVALRQRVARGLFPVDEAWTLTRALLASPDPAARIDGLLVAPVFTGDAVEAAVRPLLKDTDPDVAASAQEALDAIKNVRKVDATRDDAGS